MTQKTDAALDVYIKAALGRKAYDMVVLDVHDLTSVADTFIICSGRSNRQVTAIAEFIETELKKEGIRPLHTEGKKDGLWALLDYGHVVYHVFYEPVRQFYDLEGLWTDAERIETDEMRASEKMPGPPSGMDIIEEIIE